MGEDGLPLSQGQVSGQVPGQPPGGQYANTPQQGFDPHAELAKARQQLGGGSGMGGGFDPHAELAKARAQLGQSGQSSMGPDVGKGTTALYGYGDMVTGGLSSVAVPAMEYGVGRLAKAIDPIGAAETFPHWSQDSYGDIRNQMLDRQNESYRANPNTATIAQTVGAFDSPVFSAIGNGVKAGTSILRTLAGAGAMGAEHGATQVKGNPIDNPGDYATSMGSEAAGSMLFGGLAHGLTAGAGTTVDRFPKLREVFNRGMEPDQAKVLNATVDGADVANLPDHKMLADVNPAQAQAVRSQAGREGQVMDQALTERNKSTPDRLYRSVEKTLGLTPGSLSADLGGEEAAQQADATPAYAKARASAPLTESEAPEIFKPLRQGRPAWVDAYNRASTSSLNETGDVLPKIMEPDPLQDQARAAYAKLQAQARPDATQTNPNFGPSDLAARAAKLKAEGSLRDPGQQGTLSRTTDQIRTGGEPGLSFDTFKNIKNEIYSPDNSYRSRKALQDWVGQVYDARPEWKAANDQYAGHERVKEMMQLGAEHFGSVKSAEPYDITEAVKDVGGSEKTAYVKGAIDALRLNVDAQAGSATGDANTPRQAQFSSREGRAKIKALADAVGADPAKILDAIDQYGGEEATRQAIMKGSATAQRITSQGALEDNFRKPSLVQLARLPFVEHRAAAEMAAHAVRGGETARLRAASAKAAPDLVKTGSDRKMVQTSLAERNRTTAAGQAMRNALTRVSPVAGAGLNATR